MSESIRQGGTPLNKDVSYKLVIAEKPSVGLAIAKVLGAKNRHEGYWEGNGYLVSWCFGHLVQLADAKDYDPRYEKWSIDDLPILPKQWQYHILPEKQEQFERLKSLMLHKNVVGLVCATDAGREGELIFRLVYEQAGCKKPFERLWISSMEDQAIREGFENLRNGHDYDRLFASANCRSQADWAIGINATRLFTCLYRKPLSVGRVQTPTLTMLVERETRIAHFKPEKSYSVRLNLGEFAADSEHMPLAAAEALAKACYGKNATIQSIEEKEKSIGAPKLYDLTTLQRDANRLHDRTAQETLDIAQRLYEKKLITYPRTDSRFITKDMHKNALSLVQQLIDTLPWLKNIAMKPDLSKSVNDAKVGDHHAILPTRYIFQIDFAELNADERALLDLICKRFILAASAKHIYRQIVASICCQNGIFIAKGKTILQDGWKAVQKQIRAGDTEEEDESAELNPSLPPLSVGEIFKHCETAVIEHETTPPRHYTEDTLLSSMETAGNDELDKTLDTEKKGLGTPATRASIIEKLIKSGLAIRNKKQLLPTEKGNKLAELVPEIMKSPRLTAQWENQLTEIAAGKRNPDMFMDGILHLVRDIIKEKDKPFNRFYFVDPKPDDREIIGPCPRCGANVYETKSNFRCSGKDCSFALWKDAFFFANKKKTLKKTAAKSLLKTGKAKMRGFVSEKTGKKYDATVILEDTSGKYAKFRLSFDDGWK